MTVWQTLFVASPPLFANFETGTTRTGVADGVADL